MYSVPCANCKRRTAPNVCANCRTQSYCGQECQVAHAKEHEAFCGDSTELWSAESLQELCSILPSTHPIVRAVQRKAHIAEIQAEVTKLLSNTTLVAGFVFNTKLWAMLKVRQGRRLVYEYVGPTGKWSKDREKLEAVINMVERTRGRFRTGARQREFGTIQDRARSSLYVLDQEEAMQRQQQQGEAEEM